MDEREQKIREDGGKGGWHIVTVLEDEALPPFAYSIGLFKNFEHPELCVFGLPYELLGDVLEAAAQEVKAGKRFQNGRAYRTILQDLPCAVLEVSPMRYREHFGYAIWFYQGNEFPVQQCFWPDEEGQFPWATDFDRDFRGLQPNLSVAGEDESMDWDAEIDTDHVQVRVPDSELVKVTFFLQKDPDGYPPFERENLWAQPLEEQSLRVESIPYYVRGIAKGDVIEVRQQGARRFAKRLLKASGNSTLRVWIDAPLEVAELRERLTAMGCEVDNDHDPALLAIHVPVKLDYAAVLAILSEGAEQGRWDYEEACVGNEEG